MITSKYNKRNSEECTHTIKKDAEILVIGGAESNLANTDKNSS